MKKVNKVLAFSALGMVSSLSLLIGVNASAAAFSTNVKPYQGYDYTDTKDKDETGGVADVIVYTLANESVTFSVGAANGNTYGSGNQVTQTNRTYVLNYPAIYGKGQSVKGRFRNHNWTNNAGRIRGIINYY